MKSEIEKTITMEKPIYSNLSLNQKVEPGSTQGVRNRDDFEIPASFKEAWLGLCPSLP
jgi:hypothetical protein